MTAVDVFAAVRGPVEARPFPLGPQVDTAGETHWLLALRLGVSWATYCRARTVGLTWQQADVWACRIGKHPSEVWGMAWWAECEGDER